MLLLKYLMRARISEVLPFLLPKMSRTKQSVAERFRNVRIKLHACDITQTCKFHTTAYQNRDEQDYPDSELDSILEDVSYNQFVRTIYAIPGAGHRICLVQPIINKGPHRQQKTLMQYHMDEGIALVETLDNYKVVDKMVLGTRSPTQKLVFGSGNVERLRNHVCTNYGVSAVFVNVNKLDGAQHAELAVLLGLPIFDRYSIVLQIFKDHAKTKIAKLQIAQAEIPYLRSMIKWAHFVGDNTQSSNYQHIGGTGETYLETRRRLLEEREAKLKNAIKKYRTHRQLIKKSRGKKDTAVVAVVGYTNSGKTSLIQALTGDKKMAPVNQLFATLDVTAHGGHLPSRMEVIYIDTVGFISDIPTALIESFQSTLEDAIQADLIVHIRDISHPDTIGQRGCVLDTLKQLHLSEKLLENIIEIGNKSDLIPETGHIEDNDDECLLVSATKGTGLSELQNIIEEKLITCTSNRRRVFRVPNGGEECRWLYKEASVSSVIPDKDEQYLLMEVIIGKAALSRFCHYFGDMEIIIDNK